MHNDDVLIRHNFKCEYRTENAWRLEKSLRQSCVYTLLIVSTGQVSILSASDPFKNNRTCNGIRMPRMASYCHTVANTCHTKTKLSRIPQCERV